TARGLSRHRHARLRRGPEVVPAERGVAHARRQRRDRDPAPAPRVVSRPVRSLLPHPGAAGGGGRPCPGPAACPPRRPPGGARRARFGGVLRAIREDEVVAAVAGKPVFRFKVQAFAMGAGVAGLAGVLFAHYLAYVEPNMFLPQESLYVWLALILGGSGNNR